MAGKSSSQETEDLAVNDPDGRINILRVEQTTGLHTVSIMSTWQPAIQPLAKRPNQCLIPQRLPDLDFDSLATRFLTMKLAKHALQ